MLSASMIRLRVSASAGRRADGSEIEARSSGGRAPSGLCGQLAVELARLPVSRRTTELIYAFDADGTGIDAFADPVDHSDHIHVGFDR